MSIIVISSNNQRAKGRSARTLSFAPANDYAICGVDLFYLDPVFGSDTRNILRLAFLGDYSLETTTRSFEGVIAKESQSQYVPGIRTENWVKIKQINTADCVVVGWSEGEGARAPTFGSLIVAAYDDDGHLKHVGNVGGGFSN